MATPLDSAADERADAQEGPAVFLVFFAAHNMYFNMRFQELEALASLFDGVNSREELYVDTPPTALSASPFAFIKLPGGEATACRICERAVMVKAIFEVWTSGSTFTEAVGRALDRGPAVRAAFRKFLAPPRRFRIQVTAFGRTPSNDDKKEIIETLRPLFDGDEICDLKDPDTILWALEEHDHKTDAKTHLGPRTSPPRRAFIARQVAGGRSVDKKLKSGEKAYFQAYDLSQRAILGPTTLENELAFIMANCARVHPGQVALEPFCGTGGLLVALSHFGAHVFGGEIDIRVVKGWRVAYTNNKDAALEAARARGLISIDGTDFGAIAKNASARGKTEESEHSGKVERKPGWSMSYLAKIGVVPVGCSLGPEAPPQHGAVPSTAFPGAPGTHRVVSEVEATGARDIFTNFVQYRFPLPEIVICDNAMRPWRSPRGGWVDCIVTDPPYGVRAAAKKQGRDPDHRSVSIKDRNNYIPPKVSYGEDEMAKDLLDLAADALRDNGRIVFLVPVDLADFLGIDRAASERGGGPKGTLHGTLYPQGGRQKDPRLCISETTRDPLLLDETRYMDFIPSHVDLEVVSASLQILSGGLGRLLVTMSRRSRADGRS